MSNFKIVIMNKNKTIAKKNIDLLNINHVDFFVQCLQELTVEEYNKINTFIQENCTEDEIISIEASIEALKEDSSLHISEDIIQDQSYEDMYVCPTQVLRKFNNG